MEELIARISAEAGIEPAAAKKAVEFILAFLRKEGPQADVDALFAAIPGAAEAAAGGGGASGGLLGAIGGGLMGLAGQLTGLGLGMSQMQTIGRQVFAYAREKAGDEAVGQVVGAIPGLSQFL
ncbi:MAG: DUF2267 domain-containing protein [Beijerinckiaceae bacterium]|nr:DUF2267 domain-containing protein [Beijerinckiaceae bacterium]